MQLLLLGQCSDQLQMLKRKLKQGYDLTICGYDAVPSRIAVTPDNLMVHYLNPAHPFGHELVIYTLLTVPADQYPRNIYRDNQESIYAGCRIGAIGTEMTDTLPN